jgi:Tol biopolymer transport system component
MRMYASLRIASLAGLAALGACAPPASGASDAGSAAATQEMVFMQPASNATVPAPNNIFEVALMNLDGSELRQLTYDGTQKFLPHFSPDATKVVYTKFVRGGYGDPASESDIALFDLATNTETMLTSSGGAAQATFSPDGRRIAYGAGGLTKGADGAVGLYVMNSDGGDVHRIGVWSGASEDVGWGDYAWSSDDWILFTVAQRVAGCFKVRLDRMRPDGSARTQVTDGGPSCTPDGMEQSGDADPGWSADGKTIYSSRGFPVAPKGLKGGTERRLFAVSSDAWYAGKPERDLSLPAEPSCIEGVPKSSPDGARVLLFRGCFGAAGLSRGVYVADSAGAYRRFITDGFGPDWNPLAR